MYPEICGCLISPIASNSVPRNLFSPCASVLSHRELPEPRYQSVWGGAGFPYLVSPSLLTTQTRGPAVRLLIGLLHGLCYHLDQQFSTFLTLQPLNTLAQAVVTPPNHEIIFGATS